VHATDEVRTDVGRCGEIRTLDQRPLFASRGCSVAKLVKPIRLVQGNCARLPLQALRRLGHGRERRGSIHEFAPPARRWLTPSAVATPSAARRVSGAAQLQPCRGTDSGRRPCLRAWDFQGADGRRLPGRRGRQLPDPPTQENSLPSICRISGRFGTALHRVRAPGPGSSRPLAAGGALMKVLDVGGPLQGMPNQRPICCNRERRAPSRHREYWFGA
jgi:hypothetical protein